MYHSLMQGYASVAARPPDQVCTVETAVNNTEL